MTEPAAAVLSFIALVVSTGIAAAAEPLSQDTIQEIDRTVEKFLDETHTPGLTLAIATNNELRFERAFGMADVEHQVPAKTTTRFRTASIAKPMTSALILSLCDEGKLDLDKPVQTYCSDFPEKKWPVTSRQLLGHLGGVRHYKAAGEANDTRHFFGLKTALSVFKDDPLLHEPGTKFAYTSFGYNLLGSVSEGAGEADFVTLLQDRILKRAGMQHTRTDDHFAVIPNRARGYMYFSKKRPSRSPMALIFRPGTLYRSTLHDTSMKIPGGGLVSTSADLVRFAIAMNTGKLLKDKTRAAAWTSLKLNDGKETGYGLGWSIGKSGDRKTVSHGGGQSGTATYLLLAPESGTAVAIMCNLQGAPVKALANSLLNLDAPAGATQSEQQR